MSRLARTEPGRRPERATESAPSRARTTSATPRRRQPSPVTGSHDASSVPIRAGTRRPLWRSGSGRHEHEARTLGPRLTRGGALAAPSRPAGLVARQTPRPDTGLGAGQRLPAAQRARFEPVLGMDLSGVRVHDGPAATKAAAARTAHAFTVGNHVVLGTAAQHGGPAARTAVLAHELVHVRQQAVPKQAPPKQAASHHAVPQPLSGSGSARAPPAHAASQISCAPLGVQCWDAGDLVPGFVSDAAGAVADVGASAARAVGEAAEAGFDWVLEGVSARARDLPGYNIVAHVIGRDPITGELVTVERTALVELLLTYGPFGPAVSAVLETAHVLGSVFETISAGLDANRLTRARIVADIAAAYREFTLSAGIEANLAILRRYLDGFLADLRNVVQQLADRVIAMVRAVVVDLAEPYLTKEPIKPVWELTTQVLHYDPLRGVPVQVPTVEILANFLRLIGKGDVVDQMRERGTLQATADWLDTQVATFAGLITRLGTLFSAAWDAIQPANLPNLFTTLPALADQAYALMRDVSAFAVTVVAKVLELIKTSLLAWLSDHAHQTPGFHLITVIIEKNPFTGEVVPRTAENLIKGFITLLPGGEATYQSLAESGVIGDAAAKIETAMTVLGITPALITETFLGVWDLVTLERLLSPLATFREIVEKFGQPIARIARFVAVVIEVVITLVLRLMNFPSDLLASIISNTIAAIEDIKRDPVAFLRNILAALKAGFLGFFDRIGGYLLQGLGAWLFRGLKKIGVIIPEQWSLSSALELVLQVLGLNAEFLWRKLGEHTSPQTVAKIRGAIGMLSGAWGFIRDVQERGLAAIWDYVAGQLSGLWDTVLTMAREWVMKQVVKKMTARLISMLDPTGVMAIINGAIAFFDAVQSAIEYIREILEIVNGYVMTFAAVAKGKIEPGAQMIERGLADAVPVAIGFLANQAGLGNIPEEIVKIIQSLRQLVEQAVDWLIAQALRLGRAALEALGLGKGGGAGGPKHRAQELLRNRVTGHESPDQLRTMVAGIKTELAPDGLRDVTLRGPNKDGRFEVAASASPYDTIAAFVPALSGPRAVQLRADLYLTGEQDALAGAGDYAASRVGRRDASGQFMRDERGGLITDTTHYQLPPVIPGTVRAKGQRAADSKTQFGGVMLPPKPGEGMLEVMTFNTSEDPKRTDNFTHAERQLQEFLERNRPIARRVDRIHAQISHSPCQLCSGTLSTITAVTPNATKRAIHWQQLYTHPTRGTTDASLSSISGWTVDPRTVAGEAADAKDLEAVTWPELPPAPAPAVPAKK